MTEIKAIPSVERQAAATIARAVAQRLTDLARRIEAIENPRDEIDAVHRARAALRRRKPETLARLLVLEALHRGLEAQRLAIGGKPPRASLGPASLAVTVARTLYSTVAVPGAAIEDDPTTWAGLMAVWQKGPGAPAKGKSDDKWRTLAKSLTKHLRDLPIKGSTLKSQWTEWQQTEDHLPRRKLSRR